jgi:hypothetical protein
VRAPVTLVIYLGLGWRGHGATVALAAGRIMTVITQAWNRHNASYGKCYGLVRI